ncbi:MAG: hypothetical protein Q9180_006598, partial [Flavoplaca navasiana]
IARMTASDGGVNDACSSDAGLMIGNDYQEKATSAGLSDDDLVTLNDGGGHHDHRRSDPRVHHHGETDSDHVQKNVHGPEKIAAAGHHGHDHDRGHGHDHGHDHDHYGPSVHWALSRMSIAS